MSVRTLDASRPPAPYDAAGVLVVVAADGVLSDGVLSDGAVADGGPQDPGAPDWVARWCARSGWELRRHPGAGPGAAAAAARLDARVLVLRPAPGPGAGRPVGTAPDGTGRRPRVVAALHDLPDDAPVAADAAAYAEQADATLTVVHAVPRSFAERSVGLDGAVAHGRRLLDGAARLVARHRPRVPVDCALLRVRPHELVGEALDADLLVVGGPRTERPDTAGPGLVAHSALHHAPCPVLLVPR